MNKLNKAVDRIHELERELDRALDALEGMVESHCARGAAGQFTHDFLSDNERAFDVLVDAGRLECVDGFYYRMVGQEVGHEA